MSKSPSKKRGAQPKNANALKHGVYSRHYTPEELLALDQDVVGSLKDELEILRLAILDAAESVLKEPEDSFAFHDNVTALRTISVAVARLENLIQVRMTAFGDPDRREQQVESMLALMEQSEMEGSQRMDGRLSPSPFLSSEMGRAGVGSGVELVGEGTKEVGIGRGSSEPACTPSPNDLHLGTSRTGVKPVSTASTARVVEDGVGLVGEGADRAGVGSGIRPGVAPIPSLPRSSKKKRGGQPRNSNAYKHGFYASVFSSSERRLLEGDGADQLRHEETLLRILTRRTWRSMRTVRSSLPWQEYLFTVRTIGYTVFVIARLQRARRRFFGDKTDLEKDIELGLSDACADLGILDYFHAQVEK